jgi:hypothetical protein
MNNNIYTPGDFKPYQDFILQDNGILKVITTYGYIASRNQRSDEYYIDLEEIEYYEKMSFFGVRPRMIIRYKTGQELIYFIDINDFRKKYVEYLVNK